MLNESWPEHTVVACHRGLRPYQTWRFGIKHINGHLVWDTYERTYGNSIWHALLKVRVIGILAGNGIGMEHLGKPLCSRQLPIYM